MKSFWKEFLLRGLICAGGGPVVLGILYYILGATGTVDALTPKEVCIGILTITMLAFIAAGMTAIYQTERLPLPNKILIHGGSLYIAYLLTYLLNGWLERSATPIFVFSVIFVLSFLTIWAIIYSITKRNTEKLNEMLKKPVK